MINPVISSYYWVLSIIWPGGKGENVFIDDTISAIATAIGEAGIGIVRLSGSEAIEIAAKLFRSASGKKVTELPSRYAAYGHAIETATGNVIDECLLVIMRAPHSYTREDVEIQCHGGIVPLRRILEQTLINGARLAEPGEFTKRAFLNGRLDLAQAEAVIDIIRAKTDRALRMAVSHLSGSLSERIRTLRQEILLMIAHLEAAIDFPEEDIEELTSQQVKSQVEKVMAEIDGLLATAQTGKILREGLETVIIGKPNVGKSSLLNALLREKRAIVTDIPGTTRDIIEEYINIRGIPLKIIDTAGIRETTDMVERIGVERALALVERADLVLVMLDAAAPLADEDREVLRLLVNRPAIILLNKTDLPIKIDTDEVARLAPGIPQLKISAVQELGLDKLEESIVNMVFSGQVQQSEGSFVSNVRHLDLLRQAKGHLTDVLATISMAMPPDCIVVDLREAWEKLGAITGDTVSEDIIDQIFSQFCIGK